MNKELIQMLGVCACVLLYMLLLYYGPAGITHYQAIKGLCCSF